jgi:hypothetical protein
MKKAKEVFEYQLRAERTVTGTSPFLRDVWHGVLKLEEWLKEPFEPGDTVRVTVERIRKK